MSESAFSLCVFSLYMFVIGLLLFVVPNLLLSILHKVQIRTVGMLILIIESADFMPACSDLRSTSLLRMDQAGGRSLSGCVDGVGFGFIRNALNKVVDFGWQ